MRRHCLLRDAACDPFVVSAWQRGTWPLGKCSERGREHCFCTARRSDAKCSHGSQVVALAARQSPRTQELLDSDFSHRLLDDTKKVVWQVLTLPRRGRACLEVPRLASFALSGSGNPLCCTRQSRSGLFARVLAHSDRLACVAGSR